MNLIEIFARHRVAPNLLMAFMLLMGTWGILELNVQFFPNFTRDVIMVKVVWTGASAEDVESGITTPLEQALRNLDGLDGITSISTSGLSFIALEYVEDTDISRALDRVDEQVGSVRDLPTDAEEPEINYVVHYEQVARVLLTAPGDPRKLRRLVHNMKRQLLARGLGKVMLVGLPEEEIAIQVPAHRLRSHGLSLEEISNRIVEENRELPAGSIGRDDALRELRSISQRRTEQGFERLPLGEGAQGEKLTVGDVATVVRRPRDDELELTFRGQPAVELITLRTEDSDALEAARILERWVNDIRPTLAPGIELRLFDQRWQVIEGRINILLENGLVGLLLVFVVLFLFMNIHVAWWVAVGIPASFFATLAILYLAGGTINMMSLFGLIITLGIIVDDAIVVGESAYYASYQGGTKALQAAQSGAQRMLAPIISASLTTIASFLPLAFLSGVLGSIMFDIPFVVICALIASLVECFLVLPGHLAGALGRVHKKRSYALRRSLDEGFAHFQNGVFRPLVTFAISHRRLTMSISMAFMILSLALVTSGRLGFAFFPPIESNVILASASFVSGTEAEQVERFLRHLESTLHATDAKLGGGLLDTDITHHGIAVFADDEQHIRQGDAFGSLVVELIPSDFRTVRTEDFMRTWESLIEIPAGMESFTISARRDGAPGSDIEILITGANPTASRLKMAAEALKLALGSVPGVSAIEDDTPHGAQQLIYELTPLGEILGLTLQSVGQQLRAAFDGQLTQVFNDGYDEVEVRVLLPDEERRRLATLRQLSILTPGGEYVPLEDVVSLDRQRGFESLRHDSGELAIKVTANIDYRIANVNRIQHVLKRDALPGINERFDVKCEFIGRASDQADGISDIEMGALYALAMIYIVLAWVFSSYGWPLIIMAIIPFGIVGGVLGHWLMGIELTILSLCGLLGLTGIIVNDSIILVSFYQQLRRAGVAVQAAIIEAACQRLRAVLLTSVTTIAGLTPLLLEDSFQAQFLIPMAVSISFGLGFATFLVLLLVPTLLSFYEQSFPKEAPIGIE
uniref:Multidrug efflux pump subunit AcrB n=1 Tax=Candidatus Kentrum sp. FM TaxID=2126340 RepID=A0A450WBP6_9GAMM|nr:MAG: Multidrug efflux pump subunit AcrB [Candidatus Kentron sp. FM]VFJ64695.1 MAG: Multidrug efflux pump subunit AcrB [Candidatus Kentron sp. FM]VFK14496.1 MAG: Multidrug efflux pump subunit AcrB [Candidatus Kentron sp. FM]